VKFAIFHEKHSNSVSVSFQSNPYCLGSSYVLLPVSCSVSCLEHLTSRIVLSLPSSQHSGSIVRSAKCRYLSYSVSDFGGFFAPQGRHVAPMGVKFGMPNFTPSMQQWWYRTPKTENFTGYN